MGLRVDGASTSAVRRLVIPGDYLLTIEQVMTKTSLSGTWIRDRIREKKFPAPVEVGGLSRWVGSEIDAWICEIQQLPRGTRPSPRHPERKSA